MASQDQEEINEHGESEGEELSQMLSGGTESGFITAEQEKKPVNRLSLLIFGVVVLGAAGYYFTCVRQGPAAAQAAASAGAAQADQTINQFLAAGQDNIQAMRQMREATDKVVKQFRSSQVAQVPVNQLQANPFKYASDKPDPNAESAAEKRRHEEEKQAALKAAQGLQLQSILHSDARRACMINNQLYKEGQTVEEFTIQEITADAVLVKRGEYVFKLQMAR